jgi:hypothetical protein
MTRRLLGALVLVAVAAACGGSSEPTAAETRDDIAAQMVEAGLDADAADCFAEIVVDEVGVDALQDVDFSDDEPSAALGEQLATAAQQAQEECDLDAGQPGSG